MQAAIDAHARGDLNVAEKAYRSALQIAPDHPDALHYLGVIALQVGNASAAVELIEKALRQTPSDVATLVNYGNALQAAGCPEKAVDVLKTARDLNPEAAQIHANLGNAQLMSGAAVDARAAFEKALSLQPALAEARRGLAESLLKSGWPAAAKAHAEQAATDMQGAPAAMVTLGNVHAELEEFPAAIRCFEAVLQVQPEFPPVLCNLAGVYRRSGAVDKAIDVYRRALELAPAYAEGHYDLGIAWEQSGDSAKAAACFRAALAQDSGMTKAWRSLAAVDTLSQSEVQRLRSAADDEKLTAEQQMHAAFALARSTEKSDGPLASMPHVHKANRLHRASFDYDISADTELIRNIQRAFTSTDTGTTFRAGKQTPIFIVGMPRSGTTLVEQILSSHPKVYGGGELQDLPRAIASELEMRDGADYTASLPAAEDAVFEAIAKRYRKALANLTGAEFVTDKLPNNFLNVGLIRKILPDAKVVHCQRNAMATCYSIYKHYFSARGHYYAYEMTELGQYYRLYQQLMSHWESQYPGFMVSVRYEQLVADQAAETRRLVEACGLSWHESCLAFHENRRPVATISSSQVRRPLYTQSVSAWREAGQELQALRQAIEN